MFSWNCAFTFCLHLLTHRVCLIGLSPRGNLRDTVHCCYISNTAVVRPLPSAFSRDVWLPAPFKLNIPLRKLHLRDFPVSSMAPWWVMVPKRDASQVLLGLGAGCVLSRFSPVRLLMTPWTVARQAPLQGILQARILEWVAMPSSRGSSQTRSRAHISYVSCISRQIVYH